MDNKTKIHLSTFEMDLVNNTEWILTKNIVLKKAEYLLDQVQQHVIPVTKHNAPLFPAEIIAISPKISRGENYNGLPWRMLDYPRWFDKENVFAVRTMFWWGNFFSTTLHLSGVYKQEYVDAIGRFYDDLCKGLFFYCINDDPWQHHFGKENYLPVEDFSPTEFSELLDKRSFIKLSAKLPLSEWDRATAFLSGNFERIVRWLG